MKTGIHPELNEVVASCACGHSFKTKTTASDINVVICSKCHPVYTGDKGRFIDTAGRIEKFQKKYNKNSK